MLNYLIFFFLIIKQYSLGAAPALVIVMLTALTLMVASSLSALAMKDSLAMGLAAQV